jgi:hypothetical protein
MILKLFPKSEFGGASNFSCNFHCRQNETQEHMPLKLELKGLANLIMNLSFLKKG